MFDALARTSGTSEPIRCPIFVCCLLARRTSVTDKQVFMEMDKGEFHPHLETILKTKPTKRAVLFLGFDVCLTVPYRYNNIKGQLDATVTNFHVV